MRSTFRPIYRDRLFATQWNVLGAVGRSTPSTGGRLHGGSGAGLRLLIPMGATGCTQKISHIHCSANRRCAWYRPVGFGRGDQRGKYHHAAPFHPINTWTGGDVRHRGSHGFSASQGIVVRDASRQLTNVFGVYVPVTFEIWVLPCRRSKYIGERK